MSSSERQLAVLLFSVMVLLQTGCTDRRQPKRFPVSIQRHEPEILSAIADVQFDGQQTITHQMLVVGNDLLMTGRPFGFAKWNIGANPENPHLTFAVSDQIDQFSPHEPIDNRPPLGSWVQDWYASGALGVFRHYAFLSGSAGMSVVDMSDTHTPREMRRYPPVRADGQVERDEAFVLRAIVPHPTQRLLYAFREQDFLEIFNVASLPAVSIQGKIPYGSDGQNVCCVDGAVIFDGMMVVAMRSRLWMFDVESNGGLSNARSYDRLQAVNITATSRFLYVQHKPNYASPQGSGNPEGIYVIDQSGRSVAFLNISPIKFAVSQDDSHLYANNNDTAVRIYRIQWTNY